MKIIKQILLENTIPPHNKFWRGILTENSVVCEWGAIGAANPQHKEFVGENEMFLEKKKTSKLKKGYLEVT